MFFHVGDFFRLNAGAVTLRQLKGKNIPRLKIPLRRLLSDLKGMYWCGMNGVGCFSPFKKGEEKTFIAEMLAFNPFSRRVQRRVKFLLLLRLSSQTIT